MAESEGLGVPIIRIGKLLLVPFEAPPTDSEARELVRVVLQRALREQVVAVAVDVSALDAIDSYLARVLIDIVRSAASVGVRGCLVGIRAHAALTLVQMGIDALDIETFLNLDDAIASLGTSP